MAPPRPGDIKIPSGKIGAVGSEEKSCLRRCAGQCKLIHLKFRRKAETATPFWLMPEGVSFFAQRSFPSSALADKPCLQSTITATDCGNVSHRKPFPPESFEAFPLKSGIKPFATLTFYSVFRFATTPFGRRFLSQGLQCRQLPGLAAPDLAGLQLFLCARSNINAFFQIFIFHQTYPTAAPGKRPGYKGRYRPDASPQSNWLGDFLFDGSEFRTILIT